jgi:hypothetical protein
MLRSTLFLGYLAIFANAASTLCQNEMNNASSCLGNNAQSCLQCLSQINPQTTSLDCADQNNYVCGLQPNCTNVCTKSCTPQIESYGFCVVKPFFTCCPQNCSIPVNQLPQCNPVTACTPFFNKMLSCLGANAGTNAQSSQLNCQACLKNRTSFSTSCNTAQGSICTYIEDCRLPCSQVCFNEMYYYVACEANLATNQQCRFGDCGNNILVPADNGGNKTSSASGGKVSSAPASFVVSPIVQLLRSLLVIGMAVAVLL